MQIHDSDPYKSVALTVVRYIRAWVFKLILDCFHTIFEFVKLVRRVAYSSIGITYVRSRLQHYDGKVYEVLDSLHLLTLYRQVYFDRSIFRVLSVWECDELLSLDHIGGKARLLCGLLEAHHQPHQRALILG